MDISAEALVLINDFARNIVEQNGFKTKIESTTNRQVALDGADYVLTTIKVGDWQPSGVKSVSEYYGVELGRATRWAPEVCFTGRAMCRQCWRFAVTWKSFVLTLG